MFILLFMGDDKTMQTQPFKAQTIWRLMNECVLLYSQITFQLHVLQQFIMHGTTLSNDYPTTVYNAWYHTFQLLPYNSL